jgi:hypothetical protein
MDKQEHKTDPLIICAGLAFAVAFGALIFVWLF